MKSLNRGFTLLELIGVMAVIAVLGAMATPRIFEAIEDSRVSALVAQANDLRSNVARFYKDTGTWPRHIPNHAQDRYHQLMVNIGNNNQSIPGWKGPYLEQELEHPFTSTAYQDVMVTASTDYACDLDGNGTQDGKFMVYRVDQIDDSVAEKISDIFDKDAGTDSWKTAGRVKRFRGNHASVLVICLARV
ncbi:MAG: prepilin-type N-terminal cleavage/methylation domain-containing protein [Pseudomonadota bacterium]